MRVEGRDWIAMSVACLVGMTLTATPVKASVPVTFEVRPDAVVVTRGSQGLSVSLSCPRLAFDGMTVGGAAPAEVKGTLGKQPVEVRYEPILLNGARLEVKLTLQWSPKESILRKWARYRITGGETGVLKEVVLEELGDGWRIGDVQQPQSYPAFGAGFFAGVEFPIASTRRENGRILLAHKPWLRLKPDTWYETRKAVFGLAEPGREVDSFKRYISAHRPQPHELHANYNSWWTSPVPYTEGDIASLIQVFDERLYKPYHISFDTFCIDLGWSDRTKVWLIDPKLFPNGFAKIRDAAAKMHSSLGLWISPSNCYSPSSFDNEIAERQGYEIFTAGAGRYACLAGKRYSERLRDCLVEMATRWGVRHIKFDGYIPTCPEADHGHQPGELSAEAVAEGMISVFNAVRKAAPDTWMETTCMGWNPSPWWLFHVNSVIGTFGDDAPYGRGPCPVYRESYTTARDYFNLQGTHLLPIPAVAQEVLGIVHQTPEPFTNDAVMCVLRGHAFLPAYINPKSMNDGRWSDLAALLKWAKANAPKLAETKVLLPESWQRDGPPHFIDHAQMPREPYGYAHWREDGGLVVLRNPWIARQTYRLVIDCPGKALYVRSIYPEPRAYAGGLSQGDGLDVSLAPYETLVLSIGRGRAATGMPDARAAAGNVPEMKDVRRAVSRVEFEEGDAFGPDSTSLVGDIESAVELSVEGQVRLGGTGGEMLVLVESTDAPREPLCRIEVNGKETPITASSSETGWAASGMAAREHWLFLRAPLPDGESAVKADLTVDSSAKVSVWVWATKPGKPSATRGLDLPQPEVISLGSAMLLEPVDTASLPGPTVRKPRPVEKIDGVFLDALTPTSATQGWGTLQRNKSVWEKPMTIAGKRYVRGVGAHSPARIVYSLDGKYRRFQCWVGADSATNPTVTFEVLVDGKSVFESGLMGRDDPARRVDVDVSGAKTLELVVGDGGNGIMADHADWADARLIR